MARNSKIGWSDRRPPRDRGGRENRAAERSGPPSDPGGRRCVDSRSRVHSRLRRKLGPTVPPEAQSQRLDETFSGLPFPLIVKRLE